MTALDWVRSRVDPSTATALFLVGDLLAIAVFVVMGEISHDYPLLSVRVIGTYAEFVIGWLAVALPVGVYATDHRRDLTRSTAQILGAWLAADVVAQGLRSTAVFPGNAALSFAIVAFLVGGVLLVAWRLLFAFVTSRRQSTVPA